MRIAGEKTWVPVALLSLGLALLVVLLYWPATGYDFVDFDDPIHLTENPLIREGMTPEAVGKAFTRPQAEFYIPLTWLSFMLDTELWGASPRGFHLTNILLHAANMALLLLLLWRMTGSVWRSALAASLVALHPLRVESVAWITERKDVLSLFFLLLALAAYLAWARSGKKRWYATLCALFACALLSKPMAVTFPLLLLLLDFWPLGRALPGRGARQWLPLLREKIPLLGLAFALAVVTIITVLKHPLDPGNWQGAVFSFLPRLQLALTSPFIYLRKTVWPNDLAVRFEFPDPTVAWGDLLVGTGAILLITWLAWRARRERPWALFGWGWFLAALAPMGGILPTGVQWINDRFTYLPHLGLMAALAWGAGSLSRKGKVSRFLVPAAAVLCLLALAGTTRHLLPSWRNTVALWDRALALSPDDPHFLEAKGCALAREGDLAGGKVLLDRALALAPPPAPPVFHFNLGTLLVRMGDPATALPHLERGLEETLPPGQKAERLLALGIALWHLDRITETIPVFREVLLLDPAHASARIYLAGALRETGRIEEAAAEDREIEQRFPGMAVESLGRRSR